MPLEVQIDNSILTETEPQLDSHGFWVNVEESSDGWHGQRETFSIPSRSDRGGRKRPLSSEKSLHVVAMRHKGACLRCRLYRTECDNGEPCTSCNRKLRTWTIGCTRLRLQDASSLLLPGILTKQLEWAEVSAFMESIASYWRGEPFSLPLTLWVGEPLWLTVREVEPVNRALLQMYGFASQPDSATESLKISWLQSPPILPYYDGKSHQQAFDDIRMSVLTWYKSMNVTTKDTGLDWTWILFHQAHQHPERQFFNQILELGRLLQSGTPESELLQTCLRLLFFNYVMSTAFVVPEDDVEPLYKRLLDPSYRGHRVASNELVCPRGINRFLKMLLLPVLKELTQNALTGIESFLISRSKYQPELAISLSFLMLIITGRTEDSIFQRGFSNAIAKESSLSKDEARDLIRATDLGVSSLIIELNAFRLRGWARLREDSVLQEDSPMKNFLPMLDDLSK